MKKVIISVDKNKIEKTKNSGEEFGFVILSKKYDHLKEELSKSGFKEINVKIGDEIKKDSFMKKYIDMIGKIGKKYNSIEWWATSISSKNPFLSDLYERVYYYTQIIKLIEKSNENLIIISQNVELNCCIQKYCKDKSIKCLNHSKEPNILKKVSNKIFNFGKYVIYDFLILLQKKNAIRKHMKISNNLSENKNYYVLRSYFYNKSISEEGNYKDSYFGGLLQYLNEKKDNFVVLAKILQNYSEITKKISNYEDILIIPQEYFISYCDYLRISFKSPICKMKIGNDAIIDEIDVSHLINKEIKKNYTNYEIRNNLIYYYIVKNLVKKIKVDTFLYTFENHSWEKLSNISFEKCSPSTKTVGYQHAAISKYYLNFYSSSYEKDVIPLPNKIISFGSETRKIMEEYGSYEKNLIQEGCALRFNYLYNSNLIKRDVKNTIFVPLTISPTESADLIKFVNKSLKENNKYRIILRTHPANPIQKIQSHLDFKLDNRFVISKNPKMIDDLALSDIVLYTSTTVSAEALMMGVPVIHLDLGGIINVDPMFECKHLKWTVNKPDDFLGIINRIYDMKDEEYKKEQKLAREYVSKYFAPVDEKTLKVFL